MNVLLHALLLVSLPSVVLAQRRVPVEPRPAPSPANAPAVEVTFRTGELVRREVQGQKRARYDREPVGGIRVALGVDTSGSSPRYIDSPVLATAVSEEDGLVRAKLVLPADESSDSWNTVWARIEDSEHARTVATVSRRNLEKHGLPFLHVLSSATVFGIVMDGGGAAVSGAEVQEYCLMDSGPSASFQTRTDDAGRFALECSRRGPFRIHARRPGLGSASTGELRFETVGDQEIALELGGGTTLRGRIVDSQGSPVAGMRLVAVPDGYDAIPRIRDAIAEESGGGLLGGTAWTDAEGRFEIANLVRRSYGLFFDWTMPNRRDSFAIFPVTNEVPIAHVEVGADRAPVQLRARLPRVEVHVLDHEGELVPLEADRAWSGTEPRLHLRWKGPGGFVFEPFDDGPSLVSGPRALFPSNPGVEGFVAWNGEDGAYAEQPFLANSSNDLTVVELTLDEPESRSRLTVRVWDPFGGEYPGACISIRSTRTGNTVRDTLLRGGCQLFNGLYASSWSVELAPGRYRIVAACPPQEYRVPSVDRYRPAETELELGPGSETTVDLALGRAGRLELVASSDESRLTAAEASPVFSTDSSGAGRRNPLTDLPPGGGRAFLVSPRGERLVELSFTVFLPRFEQQIPWPLEGVSWVVPGWDMTCLTPIPVGDWHLRVEREGRVLFERDLVIEDGEVTCVVW